MIDLENVTIRAGQFCISQLSFHVQTGQIAVLMGRTGQGKTTILEAICGLRRLEAGTIHLDGEDVTGLRPGVRGVGYVPQDLALFPTMNVRQNLEFAPRVRGRKRSAIHHRIESLAALLGIGHLLARPIQGLSGGEAQRVALGRALAFEPRVLLLDEPMSALDDQTRQSLYHLLKQIRAATGVTTLHVTHNKAEATALADVLLTLESGRIHAADVRIKDDAADSSPADQSFEP